MTPVAIVTGAAQGVGLGIARALAHGGYAVALADVQSALAQSQAARLREGGHQAIAADLDVTRADEWSRLAAAILARWQRIDILVNNAGISPRGTPETIDEELWNRTLAVNVKGAWLGVKACLPHLKATRGTIVNIGTTRATRPRKGLFVYGVSKAALWGLTRQVAVEYVDEGVTCNMVAPGWVDTPGERLLQAAHGRPDWPAGTRNLTTPEDVGAAVLYLASPAGRKVNGDILYVDSGLHMADDVSMIYNIPDDSRSGR
jgi:3-oxoacyl-[acyl-carrier protein] reductase